MKFPGANGVPNTIGCAPLFPEQFFGHGTQDVVGAHMS
jgi:hypothetical protein